MKENNNERIIPIFFAVDNNYAPFLTVVMESIIANSSKEYLYKIYVLNNDISEEYKNALLQYNCNYVDIEFYSITEKIKELQENLKTRDYYSNAIYYRLFIPKLFPQYNKVLYLDADIVVLDDISKLFNEQIDDVYLGVISEDVMPTCQEFIDYSYKGLNVVVERYFNSGILVMNLLKMREEHILNKFLYMLDKIQFIVAPDQDFLNVLCKDKVKYLDKNWNFAPLPSSTYTDEVKLIHYKLTAKPWHYNNIQGGDKFWLYASRTKFYDYLLNVLNTYSDEAKAKDQQVEINLRNLAVKETKRINEFVQKNASLDELIRRYNHE